TTQAVRQLLAEAGCTVSGDDIVRIPRGVVEDAIDSAPKRIVIYDREGEEALFLQGKNTHFGLGVTAIYFCDTGNGERRDATLEDMGLVCRVGDALPHLDFIATPLVIKTTPEMPQEVVNQYEFEAMVSNTTKPLIVLTKDATSLGDILDMAAAVAGGAETLQKRPFVIPVLSVVSPLVYNVETLEKLLLSVDRGIPVRCSSSPMAGATAPVTLAGMLVTCNVESLGGLVISQLRRRGAPFITGNTPAIMDMRTVNIAYSAPEASILSMAVLEMGHYYGLPVWGGGCFCSSMGADQQAALEQMMGAYSCILAGAHLVPYVGGIEAGLNFSLEAAVMGDEAIGMVRRIMRGVPVDDETLAMDTIESVGPGGNFLSTEHTFRHYKKEQWQPTLLCRTTFASWVEGGRKLMGERVKEKLGEIIESHQVKPLRDDVKAQISDIIDRRKRSLS
ncbi:MAG: trimethylamine methyltransferase family protein, partial [Dehalococcoidia bacterium]